MGVLTKLSDRGGWIEDMWLTKGHYIYTDKPILEVSRTEDICKGYDGFLGVPITALDKNIQLDFGILGAVGFILDGKNTYTRLIIWDLDFPKPYYEIYKGLDNVP